MKLLKLFLFSFFFLQKCQSLRIRMGSMKAALQALNSMNDSDATANVTQPKSNSTSVFSVIKQKKILNNSNLSYTPSNVSLVGKGDDSASLKETIENLDATVNKYLIDESTKTLDLHVQFLKGKRNTSEYFQNINSTVERVSSH